MTFAETGAICFRQALKPSEVAAFRTAANAALAHGPGARLAQTGLDLSAIDRIAGELIARRARPVRAVVFDKSPESNWAVPWHQDRTIVVRERVSVAGFGPWSSKHGLLHVAPPAEVLARMVTLRVHLDRCGPNNGPLRAAVGSHRFGRVAVADVADRVAECETITCHAEPGDVWAYSTLILHASERALKPSRRRVIQLDYADFDLPGGLVWQGLDG